MSVMDRAGCRQLCRSRKTGTMVGIYNADEAGLDSDEGRYPWVTVCEDHGTLVNHSTLRDARWHAPSVDWCEDCGARDA